MILATLDDTTAITDIVPSSRIFPATTTPSPDLPFLRFQVLEVGPYEDSCGDGCELTFTIHVWAASEAQAELLCSLLVTAVDKHEGLTTCDWQRTQVLPDYPQMDVWHGMVTFLVTTTI